MKAWKTAALVGGLLAVGLLLVVTFGLGVLVGEQRAARTLGGAPLPIWLARHGAFGSVAGVDVAGRTIDIHNEEGDRFLVLVNDETLVERYRQRVALSHVKVGERIVVIGRPDGQGRIVARVVRILDPQAEGPESLWPPPPGPLWRIRRAAVLTLRWLVERRGL